jgi:hypothetical protein
LIHRLNVKTGVEVEVRNVTYYVYRRQPSFDWLKDYEYPNIITGTCIKKRVFFQWCISLRQLWHFTLCLRSFLFTNNVTGSFLLNSPLISLYLSTFINRKHVNSVKPESVFQIICSNETTILLMYFQWIWLYFCCAYKKNVNKE